MRIVCISGKAGSGKDTAAHIMKVILDNAEKRVLITHYADLVKYICREFYGWDGNKDECGRSLLQRVGTDVFRKEDEDYWVKFLAGVLDKVKEDYDVVLIPDTRFPNEIEYLKNDGFTVMHIRIDRPDRQNDRPMTAEQLTHASETSLDDYPADIVIKNDGTLQDFVDSCKYIAEHLRQ